MPPAAPATSATIPSPWPRHARASGTGFTERDFEPVGDARAETDHLVVDAVVHQAHRYGAKTRQRRSRGRQAAENRLPPAVTEHAPATGALQFDQVDAAFQRTDARRSDLGCGNAGREYEIDHGIHSVMPLVYGGRHFPDRIPHMPTSFFATARSTLLLAALALSAAPAAAAPAQAAQAAPLATVQEVDIARYAGLWYEIAAIPMWFQRNCLGDTTARYTPNPDGTIDVLNRCRTSEGTNEAHGLARIVDTQSNARLEVSFFSILGWRPVWGDYWIIALAPDYSWAVVGGPERRHGWILARTPALETATLATIHQRLEELGYDPASFVPTAQQAAPR